MKKKRRSTVPVSPGKDVTLYIPTDTPPEVIRYMNRLKEEGIFSQGVMEILIKHIVRERALSALSGEDESDREVAVGSFEDDADLLTQSEDEQDDIEAITDKTVNNVKAFSLDDIFRQASRNAGKLKPDLPEGE